jgi:hypothetical protein
VSEEVRFALFVVPLSFHALTDFLVCNHFRSGEVRMIYLFQVIMLMFVFACAMRIEAFWSWSGFNSGRTLNNLFYKSIAVWSGFLIYAFIDYSMIDYLMLVPGTNYVIV